MGYGVPYWTTALHSRRTYYGAVKGANISSPLANAIAVYDQKYTYLVHLALLYIPSLEKIYVITSTRH